MKEAFTLSGKRALVTGGNAGIGLAISRAFAEAGAAVAIIGRNEGKNRAALDSLQAVVPACRAYACDVGDVKSLPNVYLDISRDMGGIDILVNNAGAQARGRADTISPEVWDLSLRVNLTAPFVLSQCFARERIDAGYPGAILMIASLMSEASRPTTAPYTAAKGGIRQLIKALAVDWAPHGIRVNGIGPGYIETDMTRSLIEDAEFDAWVKKRTPLGRWGQPEDLQGAAVFLASDAACFVTGQILYVDGGWLATF